MKTFDFIVIGSGSAGLVCALGARYFGLKVALIEKHKIGGDCLNYGCVPSKALLHLAHATGEQAELKKLGVVTGEQSVSFKAAFAYVKDTVGKISAHENESELTSQGIEVVFGGAKFISNKVVEVKGEQYTARKIVIATGARSRALDIPGLSETGFLTNESFFELDPEAATFKSVVFIGGGVIASELAQALSLLGIKVTILNNTEHIVAATGAEVARRLTRVLKESGVSIYNNTEIASVHATTEGKSISFKNSGGDNQELVADEIFLSAGRIANTDSLGLEQTDIKTNERGEILVKETFETDVRSVFACGDVIPGPKFTHTAAYEASVVVKNTLLPRLFFAKRNYHPLPWVIFTNPEVAHTGKSVRELEENGTKFEVKSIENVTADRYVTDSSTDAYGEFLLVKGRLVGVTLYAPRAGEMIHEYSLAIKKGLLFTDLSSYIHAYPTYSEISAKVLSTMRKEKADKEWIKSIGRKLFKLF